MPKIKLQSDNAVAETLLIALYAKALEAQQPAPLIRDETAVALVEQIDYDFTHAQDAQPRPGLHDDARGRIRPPGVRLPGAPSPALVVHIGCGLDTRFERVCLQQPDNGQVTWYDLDLPEVIALRRQLIAEGARRRYLGCSVFDDAWLAEVGAEADRPALFLAEGVFPYFEEAQVKSLFLTFMQRFPGAELVCDAMSPLMVRMNNLQLRFLRVGARLHWGLRHGRDPEGWGSGASACWMNGSTSNARCRAWARPT